MNTVKFFWDQTLCKHINSDTTIKRHNRVEYNFFQVNCAISMNLTTKTSRNSTKCQQTNAYSPIKWQIGNSQDRNTVTFGSFPKALNATNEWNPTELKEARVASARPSRQGGASHYRGRGRSRAYSHLRAFTPRWGPRARRGAGLGLGRVSAGGRGALGGRSPQNKRARRVGPSARYPTRLPTVGTLTAGQRIWRPCTRRWHMIEFLNGVDVFGGVFRFFRVICWRWELKIIFGRVFFRISDEGLYV